MADILLRVAPPLRPVVNAPVITAAGVIAAAAGAKQTAGMVALIPTVEDATKLAVDGGTPPEELHLTLTYLGDDVTEWDPELVEAVQKVAREITDPAAEETSDRDGPVVDRPGQTGPLTLTVFSHCHFNPNGDGDRDPCMVYQFSGDGDLGAVEYLADTVRHQLRIAIGEVNFPEQHPRFEPHVTAGYGLAPDALSYTGPVTFDRLRVALGGTITDYPLGGTGGVTDSDDDDLTAAVSTKQQDKTAFVSVELGDEQHDALTAAATALLEMVGPVEAYRQAPLVFFTPESLAVADQVIQPPLDEDDTLIASAGELPPVGWFEHPGEPFDLGIHVDGRRVWGWLAEWDVPHIGASGSTIYAPRSRSNYRWFHTKSARVQGTAGPERVNIGHLTFGTGHASTDPSVGPHAAAAHYDHSGHRGAKVRVGEDEHGIWFSGALCSGIEGAKLEEFEESDTSGDWRRIMGNLELVAALCVNVGGFPKVGLSLAASGEPLALVASAKSWGHPGTVVDYEVLADTIATKILDRQAITAALTIQRDELLADLDDSDDQVMELLVSLFGDELDSLTADASRMPVHLQKSYLTGKVAARIRWNTPGDWGRCRTQALKHGMTPDQAQGACQTLHKLATGVYTGSKLNQ